jgi:C4-dicarboxylate-specific signal transduction histidine kinase
LEEASNRFTEDLVHLKGLNQLIGRIEGVIKETLYPQSVAVFIYNEDNRQYELANTPGESKCIEIDRENHFLLWLEKNNRIAYRSFVDIDPAYSEIKEEAKKFFELTGATVAVPLILNERLLGLINLSKKANLKRYKTEDFHFLSVLRNQASIAISNSLLYENIEKQVRDKTKELIDTQKQLIQAEKLATVGTLAGGVAHEINNPLTAILTNIQMMLASGKKGDLEFDRESLELIEEATKRCRSVVKQLMLYAGKPIDATKANKQDVDLAQAVKNVVYFLGYQLQQDNITVIPDIKEDDCIIVGNSNELEQVITNLILNGKDAIKRIKKSGAIRVTLSKSNNWIKLEVQDEGAGIADEIMPKIFDPFFTTKDVGKGVGLGLSICQSIIEQHNGVISVKSKAGEGTAFSIKFPKKRA